MLTRFPARIVALAFALLAMSPGCAKSPTRPGGLDVQLSLSVQPSMGGPSTPIAIDIHATNAGVTQVWHCDGCGCGNGVHFQVLGPDGVPVALNPGGLLPACPDGLAPLPPGGVLVSASQFTGVLYKLDTGTFPPPAYAAPAGTYTVVATFTFTKSGHWDGEIGLTRTATFVWNP